MGLRAWQTEAIGQFFAAKKRTWLTTATPGAGKTRYALQVADELRRRGLIRRLYIVCPTDHLRTQWVEAAALAGFDVRPVPNGTKLPPDADGAVVTYAQVAMEPRRHQVRVTAEPTMVILDEVHHAGDSLSWGSGVVEAFEGAFIRFPLTGTPFRSDQVKIAHVQYRPTPDGGQESIADYTYGYTDALRDRVVRPVVFATYSGSATWATSANEVQTATLGDPTLTVEQEQLAWKTALDPAGQWIPHVFAAAWGRVTDYRRGSIPDAKVLIPASNQAMARAYAAVWRRITGDAAVLVLSDDPESAARLAEFRDDPDLVCCVCVRMVTEGVDIPAAAVLVWSTTAATPMFFRQMVGRVLRARNPHERATVFLPAVRPLLALAADMERERDHVLQQPQPADDLPDEGEVSDAGDTVLPDDEPVAAWRPLSAQAAFDDVIGTGTEELFGLPGLLTADQERALLQQQDVQARELANRAERAASAAAAREAEQLRLDLLTGKVKRPAKGVVPARTAEPPAEEAVRLRREIASAVRARAAHSNIPPADVWRDLYRAAPGPKNATATLPLLRKRIAAAKTWGAGDRPARR